METDRDDAKSVDTETASEETDKSEEIEADDEDSAVLEEIGEESDGTKEDDEDMYILAFVQLIRQEVICFGALICCVPLTRCPCLLDSGVVLHIEFDRTTK
jgi:hypothetical protein